MENVITMQNLRQLAYCNHAICEKPIKGLVVSFFGFGGSDMYEDDHEDGIRYAKEGILYLVPYQNPWAWMNKQNVEFTDALVDFLFKEYNVPETLPVVYCGGSMGGLSALVYTVYAKHMPIACVTNCPVCDLPCIDEELYFVKRAVCSAFWNYEGTLDDAMRTASPIHLIDVLPTKTKYYNFHCDKDETVSIKTHSEPFVEKMREKHSIEYYIVPDKGHCDLTPEMWEKYYDVIMQSFREYYAV